MGRLVCFGVFGSYLSVQSRVSGIYNIIFLLNKTIYEHAVSAYICKYIDVYTYTYIYTITHICKYMYIHHPTSAQKVSYHGSYYTLLSHRHRHERY